MTRPAIYRRPFFWLVLFVLGMSSVVSSGIMTGDAYQCFVVTESLVRFHDVDISDAQHSWPMGYRSQQENGTLAPHGRQVGRQEIGVSLYFIPFYVLGLGLGYGVGEPLRTFLALFVTTLLAMPLASLAALWLTHETVRRLAPEREAMMAALALWIATPLCVYARDGYREPLLAALIAAYLWRRVRQVPGTPLDWISASALGCLITVKSVYLPICILLWLVASIQPWRQGTWATRRRVLLSFLPIAAAVILCLAYNILRFGSWIPQYSPGESVMGYYVLTVSATIKGIVGLWLSPTKSLFLYAPVTLLGVLGLRLLWREQRQLCLESLVLLVGVTLVHAPLVFWHGDGAWGPRYILPCLPILLLGSALWLKAHPGRRAKSLYAVLILAGFLVQIPALLLRPDVSFDVQRLQLGSVKYFSWNPALQPIVLEYGTLVSAIREEYQHSPLPWSSQGRPLSLAEDDYFNTWQGHLFGAGLVQPGSGRAFTVWIVTFLLMGVAIGSLVQFVRLRPRENLLVSGESPPHLSRESGSLEVDAAK